MIKINLLPVRASAKREVLMVQAGVVAISFAVLLAIMGYVHYSISSEVGKVKATISRTESEIKRLSTVIAKVNKFKSESKTLKTKLDVIKTLDEGREGPVHMIDELTRMIPLKLWLTNLKESDWQLSMSGNALDHETIADFMANMEKSPMFRDVQLKGTRKEKGAGLEVLQFTIEATFKPPITKEG